MSGKLDKNFPHDPRSASQKEPILLHSLGYSNLGDIYGCVIEVAWGEIAKSHCYMLWTFSESESEIGKDHVTIFLIINLVIEVSPDSTSWHKPLVEE